MNDLPPYQPIVGANAQELDESHYERLNINDLIRTYDQCYLLVPSPHWVISSFFPKDKQKVTGRTTYRRPNSLRAWVQIAPQVAGKVWANLRHNS